MKKILVVRNDKLGDFMLIWPALSYLKKSLPETEITCLVNQSCSAAANICPFVNDTIIDQGIFKLKKIIKEKNFDASISFFSTFKIGYVLKSSGIPIRLAPATKIAQFFYNYKLKQRRSQSKKPEHEYNTDLIIEFLEKFGFEEPSQMDKPPYLVLDKEKFNLAQSRFIKEYNINPEKKIIFIHPGSGGSSKNISLGTYSNICNGLRKFDDYNFIINFSKKEKSIAENLISLLDSSLNVKQIIPTESMHNLMYNIGMSDVFISGSTGPLHIAGALNKKTVAFYPKKKSSTKLRWQTINDFNNRIEFSDIGKDKKSISINTKKTILEIQKFISHS